MTHDVNQIVLITGASRGIGRACALELASPQNTLILTATNKEKLTEVKVECEKKGAKVYIFSFDLKNVDKIKDFILEINQTVGPIDVLINNAGIWIEKPFLE